MKSLAVGLMFCLCFAVCGFSQQSAADAPATRQDVEMYLHTIHLHQMMANTAQAMLGPMREMIHEQYVKNRYKCDLPPDFEAKMEDQMSAMMKNVPWDQMIQAVVPVYQKDLTAAEVHALTVFYSGPMGQDILRKTPVVTADSMKVMMPMIQKQQATFEQALMKDITQTLKESKLKSCPVTAGT